MQASLLLPSGLCEQKLPAAPHTHIPDHVSSPIWHDNECRRPMLRARRRQAAAAAAAGVGTSSSQEPAAAPQRLLALLWYVYRGAPFRALPLCRTCARLHLPASLLAASGCRVLAYIDCSVARCSQAAHRAGGALCARLPAPAAAWLGMGSSGGHRSSSAAGRRQRRRCFTARWRRRRRWGRRRRRQRAASAAERRAGGCAGGGGGQVHPADAGVVCCHPQGVRQDHKNVHQGIRGGDGAAGEGLLRRCCESTCLSLMRRNARHDALPPVPVPG